MSTYACLFALEREYGIRAFLNPGQVEMLGNYFGSETYKKNFRNLEVDYPDWKNINWTLTYP